MPRSMPIALAIAALLFLAPQRWFGFPDLTVEIEPVTHASDVSLARCRWVVRPLCRERTENWKVPESPAGRTMRPVDR